MSLLELVEGIQRNPEALPRHRGGPGGDGTGREAARPALSEALAALASKPVAVGDMAGVAGSAMPWWRALQKIAPDEPRAWFTETRPWGRADRPR